MYRLVVTRDGPTRMLFKSFSHSRGNLCQTFPFVLISIPHWFQKEIIGPEVLFRAWGFCILFHMMSMSELLIRWNFDLCNWCFKDPACGSLEFTGKHGQGRLDACIGKCLMDFQNIR